MALIVLCKIFSLWILKLKRNVVVVIAVVVVVVRPTAVAESLSNSVTCVQGKLCVKNAMTDKKNSLSVRELMFSGYFSLKCALAADEI